MMNIGRVISGSNSGVIAGLKPSSKNGKISTKRKISNEYDQGIPRSQLISVTLAGGANHTNTADMNQSYNTLNS
jgi:hypothetical protein